MGGNKDNMRQAMKELLGLVGFGPEEREDQTKPEQRAAQPAQPVEAARPAAQMPKIERAPAVERPVAPEPPKIQREPVVAQIEAQPKAEAPKTVEPPKVEPPKVEPPKAEVPVAQPKTAEPPKVEKPVTTQREGATDTKIFGQGAEPMETDLEATRRKVASTVERGFFSFGRKDKRDEPTYEAAPVYTAPVERPYTPPVAEAVAVEQTPVDEETVRPPFIRPGATVIAAGATFFGDIRAEGDVEVLGKVKGNLEATGNIRVTGKVLGDVKGEAVVLEGCTVQGNITSTSFVSLDSGAMVVGDVLATDFQSNGKVKGNLQIARAASFASCALLAGNVIAATIMMSQGARVQGAVRIAEDPETNSLFGELEI